MYVRSIDFFPLRTRVVVFVFIFVTIIILTPIYKIFVLGRLEEISTSLSTIPEIRVASGSGEIMKI